MIVLDIALHIQKLQTQGDKTQDCHSNHHIKEHMICFPYFIYCYEGILKADCIGINHCIILYQSIQWCIACLQNHTLPRPTSSLLLRASLATWWLLVRVIVDLTILMTRLSNSIPKSPIFLPPILFDIWAATDSSSRAFCVSFCL